MFKSDFSSESPIDATPSPFEGLQLGINHCTNAEYHADRNFLSSSVLKTIYKDLGQYYKEYILGEKPEFKNQEALLVGTLTHTLILEPHLFDSEYIVSPAFRRNEKIHTEFIKNLPAGEKRTVITAAEKNKVDRLVSAYRKLPAALRLMANSLSEHTMCTTLQGVPVKVRCDAIDIENGRILDVKTTGYGSDLYSFKSSSERLMYELSGALYCAVAEEIYNKPFDFYFIVLSKQEYTCDIYKLCYNSRISGMKKVFKALQKYKQAKETGIWTENLTPPKEDFSDYEIQEI